MIRCYFLLVETIDGAEQVDGMEFIHDALLETTAEPNIRMLIQNTTQEEDDELCSVAITDRDATQQEIDRYNSQVIIVPPDPDITRAQELLATSPQAITMPEMWELMRIFGRRLGIPE